MYGLWSGLSGNAHAGLCSVVRLTRVACRSGRLASASHVFMRWKEQCFLDAGEDCGLTIAGFYYVCLDRRTGDVDGARSHACMLHLRSATHGLPVACCGISMHMSCLHGLSLESVLCRMNMQEMHPGHAAAGARTGRQAVTSLGAAQASMWTPTARPTTSCSCALPAEGRPAATPLERTSFGEGLPPAQLLELCVCSGCGGVL